MSEAIILIDLDVIYNNFIKIQEHLNSRARNRYIALNKIEPMPVLKAGCYNIDNDFAHVPRTLYSAGARKYCVGYTHEGVALRDAIGPDAEIYVLYPVAYQHIRTCVENDLIVSISSWLSFEQTMRFNDINPVRVKKVSVYFNSASMNRSGFEDNEAAQVENALKSGSFEVKVVMTHMRYQGCEQRCLDDYAAFRSMHESSFKNIPRSTLATSHIFHQGHCMFDMPRIGGGLYIGMGHANLMDSFSIYSRLIAVKHVPKGATVSYNGLYICARDSKIGMVAFGYSSVGITAMSNTHHCFYKGMRCQVVGAVCMDTTMIDLTDVSDDKINVGDFVEVIGPNARVYDLHLATGMTCSSLIDTLNTTRDKVYYNTSMPDECLKVVNSAR